MDSNETAWSIDPRVQLRVVPNEAVYALIGERAAVLRGAVYEALVPLIDGTRTTPDLVVAVAAPPAEVHYAVQRMRRRGYVVPAAPPDELAADAWWRELDADPAAAAMALRRGVRVQATTRVDAVVFAAAVDALAAAGVGDGGDEEALLLVLATDYTDDELAEVNRSCLAEGRDWLLVLPGARRLWLGPLLRPGRSPCWECLRTRLRAHRRVHTYLASVTDDEPMPVIGTPATAQLAGRIAALEAVKLLGGIPVPAVPDAPADSAVLTELDLADWGVRRHVVVRRPQCPACGDPTPPQGTPVVPQAERPSPGDDGGSRTVRAEETYRRFRYHVSPITGAASELTEYPMPDAGMHVWRSGTNPGLPAKNLLNLRRTLRSMTAGKGTTREQARVGALSEALERYSGMTHGEEPRIRGSLRGLGDAAIHPNDCMLFSDAQFDDAERINARDSWFDVVPARFDETAELDWTPLWSLTHERWMLLPTDCCYYGESSGRAMRQGLLADSNGCAAGNTLTEAILQGFLELVERDSIALWWYNRLSRPAVDLVGLADPWADEVIAGYRRRGREVWALDLTTDLGIPAFVALSRRTDHATERILMGFGAHLDGRVAVLRALAELNQMSHVGDDPPPGTAGFDRDMERWMTTATVANQPYLLPDPAMPPWRLADHPSQAGMDLAADVLSCRRRVEAAGLAIHVLDQTRPDIGLPVARVVVPGLRPFWSRLAPGRLYDVPVRMGWLDAPLAESELNPIAMFL